MSDIILYNRDGYDLKLVHFADNKWALDFGNFPEWGGIQVTTNNGKYMSIDPTPGGPYITIGTMYVSDGIKKIITNIDSTNDGFLITMEDMEDGTNDTN